MIDLQQDSQLLTCSWNCGIYVAEPVELLVVRASELMVPRMLLMKVVPLCAKNMKAEESADAVIWSKIYTAGRTQQIKQFQWSLRDGRCFGSRPCFTRGVGRAEAIIATIQC